MRAVWSTREGSLASLASSRPVYGGDTVRWSVCYGRRRGGERRRTVVREGRRPVADLVVEGEAKVGLRLVDLWQTCESHDMAHDAEGTGQRRTSASRCSETTFG